MALLQWHMVYRRGEDELHRAPVVALKKIPLGCPKICNLSRQIYSRRASQAPRGGLKIPSLISYKAAQNKFHVFTPEMFWKPRREGEKTTQTGEKNTKRQW